MLRKFNEPRNNKKTWKINIISFSSINVVYYLIQERNQVQVQKYYYLLDIFCENWTMIVIGQTISAKFFVQTIYLEL